MNKLTRKLIECQAESDKRGATLWTDMRTLIMFLKIEIILNTPTEDMNKKYL